MIETVACILRNKLVGARRYRSVISIRFFLLLRATFWLSSTLTQREINLAINSNADQSIF